MPPDEKDKKISALEKQIESLKKTVKGLTKKVDQAGTGGVDDIKLGGGAFDFIKEGKTVFDAFRESVKDTGTLLDPNGELFSQIAGFGEQSVELFGGISQGIKAAKDLQSGLRIFNQVGADSRTGLVDLAIRFKELGVNMSDMNKILDSSVIGFGQNTSEAKALAEEVGAIGNATGVGMREAVRNFAFAQSRMAYSTSVMKQNFKDLQMTSAQTGIGFETLTNAFGDSMDTFEGSASKAGNLNAILGRSVFNSIDLLGKTEGDRVKTIVKGIRESVNVTALSKNKFQLKAVAEGLGLSVDQTRRLLSGQMSVDEAMAQKKDDDPRAAQMKKMAENLKNANSGLEQFDYLIRRTRTVFDNAAVSINAAQRSIVQRAMAGILDTTNTNPADFMRAINEVGEAALQGGIDQSEVGALVKSMTTALFNMAKKGKMEEVDMKKAKQAIEKVKARVQNIGDPTVESPEAQMSFGNYNFFDKKSLKDFGSFFSSGAEQAALVALKGIKTAFESTTFKLVVGEKSFDTAIQTAVKKTPTGGSPQ